MQPIPERSPADDDAGACPLFFIKKHSP